MKSALNWVSEGSRDTVGMHSLIRALVSRTHEA